MAIEIVDLPIKHGDFPISYVNDYQINGNSRILKWRYVRTICLAIFCGDIP